MKNLTASIWLLLVSLLLIASVAPCLADDYYAQHPAVPFHSTTLQEASPVQTAAAGFPNNLTWSMQEVPSIMTYKVAFAGKPGNKASHEGVDFVHTNSAVPHVPVIAAADGTVAYVRTGCPQSAMFGKNASLREAGAGWGNHVVLYHGNGIYTRYAHLAPNSIKAKIGDRMTAGDVIGEMGNTGRSETRHLHFEIGYKASYFVAGKPSQSFDLVLNPEKYFPKAQQPTTVTFVTEKNNVRSGPSTSDKIIAVAPKGKTCKIVERCGEWLKVTFSHENNEVTGWTHQSNT